MEQIYKIYINVLYIHVYFCLKASEKPPKSLRIAAYESLEASKATFFSSPLSLQIPNIRPYPAQTDRRDAQIRGKALQRDSLQQFGVVFEQGLVALGGGGE